LTPPAIAHALEAVGPRRGACMDALHAVADELRGESARRSGRLRRAAPLLAVVAAALLALAVLRSGALAEALNRAISADWRWVLAGVVLEWASVAGYVALLHHVVSSASPRLRWRDSYDMSVGGTAAARLLPTAGLGGVAVTVWALRAHGISRREVAERLIALLLVLYAVYLGALTVSGLAIATGIASAPHAGALGLAAALTGSGAIAIACSTAYGSGAPAKVLTRIAARGGRLAPVSGRAAAALPSVRGGGRRALEALRHPRPQLLGAAAWWAFDVGVLLSTLRAFGARPSMWVLALSYFAGTVFNLVPLPGSLSGGLAGALIALGVASVVAIPAVLAYRAIAIWLPAAAGLPSLVSLRGSVARWRAERAAAGAGASRRADRLAHDSSPLTLGR
jgi:uncharacterized membrane protein YbhN (UPF0104 family)